MRTGGARFFLATSLAALTASAEAGETVTYSYDALGRLTGTASSGTVNNGVETGIAYDPAGNRAAYNVTGASAPPPTTPSPSPSPSPSSPPPPPPPPQGPPTAVDDHGEGQRCQSRDFNVVANDSDPDGDPLTVTSVTGGPAFSVLSSTTIRYTNGGQVGPFSATYMISDGRGGTASATLYIEVPRDICL
jgi:YD repeat-containing protein